MVDGDIQTLIDSIRYFWMPSTPTARRIFGWDRTDTEKKVRHTT